MKNRYSTLGLMSFLIIAGALMIYFAFSEKQPDEEAAEQARTVTEIKLKGDFDKKWAVNMSGELITALAAEGETAFISANGITAVDAENGSTRWVSTVPARTQSLVTAQGAVFGVDNEGRLISLDSETGQERWRIETGDQYGQAAVAGNNVFYIDGEGVAVAVDMESGREQWRSAIAGAASLHSSVSTAAEGETIYIQSSDSHARMKMLTAMSSMDGAVRWTHPLDDVSPSICAGPGMVFLLTSTQAIRDGHPFTTYNLIAFDDIQGSTMWESKIDSDFQPLLKFIDGALYYGTFSENGAALHGLDPASGIERWSARPEGRSSVPTAFAVRDGLVYMNDMSEMYAADIKTGKIWWNVKAGGPLMVTPVIAGDSICFAFSAAGTLYALPLPAD